MKIFSKHLKNTNLNKFDENSNTQNSSHKNDLKYSATRKPIWSKNKEAKINTLIDKGCDPIVALAPKLKLKRGLKTVLNENFKPEKTCVKLMDEEKNSFDHLDKFTSNSPQYSLVSIQSAEQSSIFCGNRTLFVRDFGIQCQAGLLFKQTVVKPSLNPLLSLEILINRLKENVENLEDKHDKRKLHSIVYDMNNAVKFLLENYTSNEMFNSVLSIEPSNTNLKNIGKIELSLTEEIEKSLVDTCNHLQASYYKMEKICSKLKEENDSIIQKYVTKSNELEKCQMHELEIKTKINDIRKSASFTSGKVEECTESMEKLEEHVKKLQEESKNVVFAEEEKLNLSNQISKLTVEKERLHLEVQLLMLEKEKYRVLLQIKNEEILYLRAEIRKWRATKERKATGGGDRAKVNPDRYKLEQSSSQCVQYMKGAMSPVASQLCPAAAKRYCKDEMTKFNEKLRPLKSVINLKKELRELFSKMKIQTEISESNIYSSNTSWTSVTNSS